MARCELSHIAREPIDLSLAREQHRVYEQTLGELGCEVCSLPEERDLADCVFVEDTAVVVAELALLARSGAVSRRAEVPAVATLLKPHRRLERIVPPGTLDGGDVLVLGRRVFVGSSGRTDRAAFEQLESLLGPLGYEMVAIPVRRCLHLKSAVTRIGENRVLANRDWIDADLFPGIEIVDVHPREAGAANVLIVGDRVICATGFPRTRDRLAEAGVDVREVDLSELAKAEGGVTCCSIVYE